MRIFLGPILGFRGGAHDLWQIGVLCVLDRASEDARLHWRSLAAGGAPAEVAGEVLKRDRGRSVVRYELAVPRAAAQEIEYGVGDGLWRFHVPAKGANPHMAFASCNGFSSPKAMSQVDEKNERWEHMAGVHEREPLHLLLLGGDQIYADSIWSKVSPIERWNELSTGSRAGRAFTKEMRVQVERFYFDLYCDRWSQAGLREMLAAAPSLMTWDDHDIFDGWGSYDPEIQQCPVYQGIFEIAWEHFCIFQHQTRCGAPPPGAFPGQGGLSSGHRLGDLALLLVDTRSERTLDTIVSQPSWNAIFSWLDETARAPQGAPKHLLVVIPIPVVYPRMHALEWIAGWDFRHEQERLEDDLRDQWTSASHHGERVRLAHRLFDLARKGTRVTILSGDVHVAALGVLQSARGSAPPGNAATINQLVSSAIVHAPPGAFVRWVLDRMAGAEDELDRDIRARMLEVPGSGGQRIINRRNWLELEVDGDDRIWANWHFEGDAERYTKVIHPVRADG